MSNLSKGAKIGIFAAVAIIVFCIIFGGISLTQNLGKSKEVISTEEAGKKMENLLKGINVTQLDTTKATITNEDILSEQDELPDISNYPFTVNGNGDINLEIYASPEKAGNDKDGWINEVAARFNSQQYKVNGKTISVSIRSITSGLAVDYITSGKYTPDALTPSNDFWGKMVEAKGIETTVVSDRLVGNVAGILLSKEKYDQIIEKYGSVNMKVITEATTNNEIAMGYTNPFVSSTGYNFLVSTLYAYDTDDLLSTNAVDGFTSFQKNVPLVSYNTLQMRDAAESGSLDAFILEYQLYTNDSELKRNYVFTPFGARHDNPLYAIGDLSSDKSQALQKFAEYCQGDESQNLATQYGFNENDSYKSELPNDISGNTLVSAQKLYKENKDTSKTIMAVFVADISGSMAGEPINALQTSLINSIQYINKKNYIGLVSYNSKVFINLPIAQFDLNQQAMFKGAVKSLDAGGSTATYDAVVVAMDMLEKAKQDDPTVKPMLFLLSDGEQNYGCSLNDISSILATYQIPVYTIGYNANISALEQISSINEAATINADSDDIIYQLKNLFNSEM